LQAGCILRDPLLVVAGKVYGSHFQTIGNLQVAETFYRGALRVSNSLVGKRALARVYGSRNIAALIQQYLALLMKKQKRYKDAEEFYLAALEAEGVSLQLTNIVLHQLATLYSKLGDIVKLK
jgi:tetratricopeptide (TPR) repeat protein